MCVQVRSNICAIKGNVPPIIQYNGCIPGHGKPGPTGPARPGPKMEGQIKGKKTQ
jgi:hypothetical protein